MWHTFGEADLSAVKEVLDRGVLGTIGKAPAAEALQAAFCDTFGSPHALGVCNAMAGLHSAVAAAGAGAGDEVVVDSLVGFGAVAVMFNNAIPVFADVRRDTHTMDPASLRERISERTKAVIVTQLWGLIADMDEIMQIAREHDLLVIEDCAHAIYATYKGRYAGTIGDVGVFSFQESKQLSTGDGGIVLYRDPEVGTRLEEMVTFGTMPSRIALNYRITEVTAAIARVQLAKTPSYVDICVRSAKQFSRAVHGNALIREQAVPAERVNTYHLWAATYEGEDKGLSYDEFQRIAGEHGVHFMWRYIQKPPYLHDVIRKPNAFGRGCPVACPLRSRDAMYYEGACPTAEHIMSRLMLAYTGGDPDANAKIAENFHSALAAAGG